MGITLGLEFVNRYESNLLNTTAQTLDFIAEVGSVDDQELMARATGNYKRGNERMSAEHPRNRRPS